MNKYDAIVIGSGAGGGVAAYTLVEHGLSVLVLERGEWPIGDRDHLRNYRLSQYGRSGEAHPGGNPRLAVSLSGSATIVEPYQGGYQLNAIGVGGGTSVYGGQAWRFHPLDFQMASTYGSPAGSSLADWPIRYEDLEPYYEEIEHLVGVSGSDPAPEMPARRRYPMPAVPLPLKGQRLEAGARSLGWSTQRVPLLINSEPRDGRAGCAHCQHCVGFGCPVDAKNGTQNTVLPKAVESGRCTVLTGAVATHLERDEDRIASVTYYHDGKLNIAEADSVFVCAGAIETARLLLISGFDFPALGRNLQGHFYSAARGLMREPIYDGVGPGASISTIRFNHGNDGIIGGGMLADDFIMLPISFAKGHRPPSVPAWGLENKRWMRDGYRRYLVVTGPTHDIPSPTSRVSLDRGLRDWLGLPAARLSGATHPETIRTTAFMALRAEEWLRASGAEQVWLSMPALGLSGGQHQAGTCRMGEDPSSSVVDPTCRVHGMRNLFLADGSVHVTNGGFNPVLTIMSLTRRTAKLACEAA